MIPQIILCDRDFQWRLSDTDTDVASIMDHPVGAELALIGVPATLLMLLEELQKIYFIQKS